MGRLAREELVCLDRREVRIVPETERAVGPMSSVNGADPRSVAARVADYSWSQPSYPSQDPEAEETESAPPPTALAYYPA